MEPTAPPRLRNSILLYLVIAFTAYFPCLILGEAYFANDLAYQFVPFRQFLRDQLFHGHFPLWNPYLFGGQPFFANPNSMMCYPLTYLTLLFPVAYGVGVFLFIHMFLAASGMHFWLRSLKLSENACRMGSLAFALSGVVWWETIHLQILAAYALFPWLMGAMERWMKEWKAGWAFAVGLAFALVFCCGGFQSTTCVFYTALCYFLARLTLWKDFQNLPSGSTPSSLPWKKIIVTLLITLWGGLPLLAQLVPGEEFSRLSNRRDPTQTYDNFNGTFCMQPHTTYEFLFPTLGLPQGQTIEEAIQSIDSKNYYSNDFLGDFGYIGIWAPLFFFWAFRRKEKKFLAFLAVMGVLSILTAWGRYVPLHRILCILLPGVDLSRAPFRFVQTYVLFGCALLAYGWQTLERRLQEKGGDAGLFFPAVIYASVLFLAGLLDLGQTWREMLALGLGLAGFSLWAKSQSWKSLGRWAFQVALIFPMLLFGWNGYSLGPASNFDYKSNSPLLSAMSDAQGIGRYFFDSQSLAYPFHWGTSSSMQYLPENAVVPLRIRDVKGYSPIMIKRSDALTKLPFKNFFELMDIKAIASGRPIQVQSELEDQTLGTDHLYSFKNQPSYAYAPEQAKGLPDDDQVFAALGRPDFNPAQTAYFTGSLPADLASQPAGPNPGFTYSVLKDEVDSQAFKLHMDKAGPVVFSEVVFPGWKARVDGRPADLLTADYCFRSVAVPAGDHEVDFLFAPWWANPLKALLVLWALSAAAYGISLARKKPALEPSKA